MGQAFTICTEFLADIIRSESPCTVKHISCLETLELILLFRAFQSFLFLLIDVFQTNLS